MTSPYFQQHAERLFIPHNKQAIALYDEHGLPSTPNEWNQANQKSWAHWNAYPLVVLLGESGSGKTREFDFQIEANRRVGRTVFRLRMQDYYGECELASLTDNPQQFRDWLDNGKTPADLFFDSIDEARLDTDKALQKLVDQLSKIVFPNVRIRLSCRARDWREGMDETCINKLMACLVPPTTPPHSDQQSEPLSSTESTPGTLTQEQENSQTESIQEQTKCIVLELLPLDYSAIAGLVGKKTADVDQFMCAAKDRRVLPLASHPLTLEMLVRVWCEDKHLGNSRLDLFERATKLMVVENNLSHKNVSSKKTTPTIRLEHAGVLAVLSVLSGRESIFMPDRDGVHSEGVDSGLTTLAKDVLLEIFDTALFTPRLAGEFRYYHRSLADFLAARQLASKIQQLGLRFAKVKALLQVEGTRIPTALRGVAGWLACWDKDARAWLLNFDPVTAITEGDVAQWPAECRKNLLQTLAEKWHERGWQREVRSFSGLGLNVAPDEILTLLAKRNSLAVRSMALDLMQSEPAPLLQTAWEIVVNPHESLDLRIQALDRILAIAPAEYVQQATTLLSTTVEMDPDDELAGMVLHELYPQHLNINNALTALRVPRQKRLTGMYRMFWIHTFEKTAPLEDLDPALEALKKMIDFDQDADGGNEDEWISELFVSLLARLLEVAKLDSLLALVPWLIYAQRLQYGFGIEDDPRNRIAILLLTNPAFKRKLMEFWVVSGEDLIGYKSPVSTAALVIEDVSWLLDMAVKTDDEKTRTVLFDMAMCLWRQNQWQPFEYLNLFAEARKCTTQWQQWSSSLLEDNDWRREEADRKKERTAELEATVRVVREQLPALASGDISILVLMARYLINHKSQSFQVPNFEPVTEEFGDDVATALRQGFANFWTNVPYKPAEWDRTNNEVPWWIVVAGFAIELNVRDNVMRWQECSEAQIETALLIALRHSNGMPNWLGELCEKSPDIVVSRVHQRLAVESDGPEQEHPRLLSTLAYAEKVPDAVLDALASEIFSGKLPKNFKASEYSLGLGLKYPEKFQSLPCKTWAEAAWQHDPNDQASYNACLPLATWWLQSPSEATPFVEKVFDSPSLSDRVAGFMSALRAVTGNNRWGWPDKVSQEATIALLPWIYRAFPPSSDPVHEGAHTVSQHDENCQQRQAAVSYVVSGDVKIAQEALMTWRNDNIFKDSWAWFDHLLVELEQRNVEDAWHSTRHTPEEIAEIILQDQWIIRNAQDLNARLVDVFENDLADSMRSDGSPIGALWKGTKDSSVPKGEKEVQDILSPIIKNLVESRRLVFTREPEKLDEKKPDWIIGSISENGNQFKMPVECKLSTSTAIWTEPKQKMVPFYMQDAGSSYGIYLVGWYGEYHTKELPSKKQKFTSIKQLQGALQTHVNANLPSGKHVTVVVLDFTRPGAV
ncbi:MAG: hypothetical protein HOP21_02095 [Methylotenera sp.]|nr:hypothetical protein [Methylotenera sp.]